MSKIDITYLTLVVISTNTPALPPTKSVRVCPSDSNAIIEEYNESILLEMSLQSISFAVLP